MLMLKIPFGKSESGFFISAKEAKKDESYFCPQCSTKLLFRAGKKNVEHFSHPPESNCNNETILHKTAKGLIEQTIKDNAQKKRSIEIWNSCKTCGKNFNSKIPTRTFTDAEQEKSSLNYRCDVVGYRGKEIALGIEIFATHAVDENKAKELPIYWIELSAEDVLKNSFCWKPIQKRLKPVNCRTCKNEIIKIQNIASKWGIDSNLYSPIKEPVTAKYIAGVETCFKCKNKIPVFWWDGIPFCEEEPPDPKPKTIKFKYSKKYGGSYWANTCANCGMTQGDNFLFIFEKGPLFGLPLSKRKAHNT